MNMRMRTVVVFFLLCAGLRAENSCQAWTKYRDSVKADPSIVAYYTFEDFDGMQLKNLAGAHHAFTTEDITLVPGRFPEKKAVLIDRGSFMSNPGDPAESFHIRGKSFTFECRLMKQAAADNSKLGAVIFMCGDGYYAGWRVVTTFPNGPVALQIGRPTGGPAVFSTSPVTDNVWHHIAATWDGKEVRMYLDGKLCSTQKYEGPYQPDTNPAGAPSWIGGSGWGVGRGILTIDELAIYDRALTAEEVKAHFLVGSGEQAANQEKTRLPEVTVSFPEATDEYAPYPPKPGGYFPVGTNIPVGFTFRHKEKQYTAHFTILDVTNQPVFQDKALIASTHAEPIYKNIRVPDKCGIYWLQVTVEDKDKKLLGRREFPFGVTVKLPDIKDVSDDSPLGVQSAGRAPEARFYGMKWDRALYRFETTWGKIEETPGTYDWTDADKIVNNVTGGGNAMLFFIHGVPDWAALTVRTGWHASYGPKNVEDMKRFLRATVNRYKDRVHYWEVWNETDCNVLASGDKSGTDAAAVEYVRILKATYEAIKEADPTAKVVGLNTCPAGILGWTSKVLKAGGGAYLDIMGFHYYVEGNPNRKFSQLRQVEQLKEIIQTYLGRQVPLWNDETAYQQPCRVNGRPMSEKYFFQHYYSFILRGADCYDYYSFMLAGADCYIENCLAMVPEHRSACWEIQATLLDFAAGVDKRILHAARGYFLNCPVHEKGVAFAALAKVVSKKKEARQVDVGTDLARGVLVTDSDGKRTAVLWSVDNRPAVVTLLLPDDGRQYAGMDFLGNPVNFGKAQEGLLMLKLTQEQVYVFDVPEKLSGTPRVMEIKGKNVAAANVPYSGEITIRNPLKKTMQAAIRPELPAGWQAEIAAEVAIPAGGATNVPFTLRSAEKMEGFLPVRFALVSGKEPVAVAELNVLMKVTKNIPRAGVDIVINGETGQWKGLKCFTVGAEKEEQVVIGRRDPLSPVERPCWKGSADLSFTVSSAWNTNVLYLLIEVTDDDMLVAPENEENDAVAYLYDCVEVFVDIRVKPEDMTIKGPPGAAHILVVPSLSDQPRACRTVYLGSYRGSGIEAKFVGRKTEKGYLVEGRIHPAPGSGLSIGEGQNIGLDIAVNDAAATPGVRKTQMVLFGSLSNWDNPSFWDRFLLDK